VVSDYAVLYTVDFTACRKKRLIITIGFYSSKPTNIGQMVYYSPAANTKDLILVAS